MKKVSSKISPVFRHPLKYIKKQLKSKPILKKALYTLLLLLIFRIAATITMPGVQSIGDSFKNQNSFINVMDMMGGGALRRFSIVALGISPYITASIIMQMLQTEAFPPIYRLATSGPVGKRKLNIATRILTIAFAFIQAITIVQSLNGGGLTLISSLNHGWFKYFVLPTILLAGSLFTLFLGEQITANGVGNGTSLIIFSGIAVTIPTKFENAWLEFISGGNSTFSGIMWMSLYLLVFFGLIWLIGYLYIAERQIPIQQTGSGLNTNKSQMSRLPIKLNPAGVMPVIFALILASIPTMVSQFLQARSQERAWINEHLSLTSWIGLLIFIVLVFIFTSLMTIVTFNPTRVAENFKKNSTFIPGIRPGMQTENYLTSVVLRLSVFSSIYLSAISSIQYIARSWIKLNRGIMFSGTSLIILVTVAIETINQMKARYKTVDLSRKKENANKSLSSDESTEGLLW